MGIGFTISLSGDSVLSGMYIWSLVELSYCFKAGFSLKFFLQTQSEVHMKVK